jgi:hypothetical protein
MCRQCRRRPEGTAGPLTSPAWIERMRAITTIVAASFCGGSNSGKHLGAEQEGAVLGSSPFLSKDGPLKECEHMTSQALYSLCEKILWHSPHIQLSSFHANTATDRRQSSARTNNAFMPMATLTCSHGSSLCSWKLVLNSGGCKAELLSKVCLCR